MTRPTKVPSIPAPTKDNLLEVAKAAKGVIEVREGLVGDPLDAFVKVRDLSDALFRQANGVGGGSSGDPVLVVGPPGPPGSIPPPDFTPPPGPTGLTATPTFTSVILRWDSPPLIYINNHAYTEVWRNSTDDLGSAILVGTSLTQFYTDGVGEALEKLYYWIRFRSKANVEGPYNDTDGTFAQTSPNPSELVDLLVGQIKDEHLFVSLGKPISSIGPLADENGAAAIQAALASHNETKARLAATAPIYATIEEERTTRLTNDLAEAAARETLAVQMRGDYTGTDLSAVSSGLIFSERQARATAVAAEASRIDSLEASVDDPFTGLLTRATALETVTTSAVIGNAALGVRASLLEASVDNPTTGLLARASVLESTTTNVVSGNIALANRSTLLESSVNTPSTGLLARAAALESVTTNVVSGNTALAARTTGLEASVNTPNSGNNPTYARLLTEESTRASLDGSVAALYTVRAEVSSGGATVVGGFGLSATSTIAGGPRIDFGVRADRFFVAAPSSVPGIADRIPFVVQATPTTINGEAVPAGVYMDEVFIKKGSLSSAQIGSLTATKITAGYTASVDLEAGTFAGSEFYIGGTITYEFGNPDQPTQRTGIASVANPNVALNSSGATFNASFFRILNGVTFDTPFEVVGGVVKIRNAAINNAAIGSAQIADTIQSTTFSSVAGWQINKSGSVVINELTARGTLTIGTADRSGTTMTGSGAKFNGSDGTGVWGNAATNITFDGSVMTMNGAWVTAANLNLGALSVSVSPTAVASTASSSNLESHGLLTITVTGGTAPYAAVWSVISQYVDPSGGTGTAFVGSSSGSTATISSINQSDNCTIFAQFNVTVTDANGRSASAFVPVSILRGIAP